MPALGVPAELVPLPTVRGHLTQQAVAVDRDALVLEQLDGDVDGLDLALLGAEPPGDTRARLAVADDVKEVEL